MSSPRHEPPGPAGRADALGAEAPTASDNGREATPPAAAEPRRRSEDASASPRLSAARAPAAGLARLRPRAGTVLLLATVVIFAVIWWRVIVGDRLLIGGDLLYCCPPWHGAAGAHKPISPLPSDQVTEFYPWLDVTVAAYRQGQLPLWDPYAMSGKPLLADDVSAVLSPFTLMALPFGAARGLSLSMLVRLWVAGLGMLVFLRVLGVRPLAAGAGGIAYAGSAFMVVWLAWPHTGVAALLPWVFAFAERYLRRAGYLAQAGLAAAICLQFLAGHAETSFHLGLGAALYCLIRCLDGQPGRLRSVFGLGVSALVGTAAAGIQLLPFLQELQRAPLISDRQGAGLGSGHLFRTEASSWIAPNLHGNPAIDGLPGRNPNYNEATGYAGAASLVMATVGLFREWLRARTVAIGLVGVGLVAAGTIYGPLSSIVGRLPGLSVSNNARMIVLLCFVVAALAGIGLDAVADRPRRTAAGPAGALALAVGLAALAVLAAGVGLFAFLRVGAEHLVPPLPNGSLTFWALVALSAMVAAGGLLVSGWLRGGVLPFAALAILVLLETSLFAGPHEPQVPPGDVLPPSTAVEWLKAHAGDSSIAANGYTLLPETMSLYRLHDVRGYDVVSSPRLREFWSHADPGYHDEALYTLLERPDARWLAAAGVRYVLASSEETPAGTTAVYRGEEVFIGEVPNARPFAFIAPSVVESSRQEAADVMGRDPLGPVVLEAPCCHTAGAAEVGRVDRRSQSVEVEVEAREPAVLVLLQTYSADWKATVDGRPVNLMPADVLFQAVQVPTGRHRVRLSYQPAAVTAGAVASAGGAAAIAVLVVTGLRRRRRRGAGS